MTGSGVSYLVCLLLAISSALASQLARGWGDSINWMPFDEGLKASAETRKPMMLVIHKSWCGACKALKPNFAKNKEIAELGTKFIMVNVEDEEEPADQKYAPDGGYIPRILFLNSNGDVQNDLINKDGNANYKYYYPQPADIVSSMKRALETIKPAAAPKPDEL